MIKLVVMDNNPALPKEFTEIPAQVYAHDPNWIPEESGALATQFSTENSWFQDGRQACVAYADGKARLAGFLPAQEVDGDPVAFFGFWETVDDVTLNRELFASVEAWARDRGAKHLYGPINFSTYGANRLRLNTFDAGCFPGEPYNPPYYADLMAQLGFECCMEYKSFPVQISALLEGSKAEYEQLKPMVDQMITMETLSPQTWLDNLDEFYELVEVIFGQNFAYTPISREAFKAALGESFAAKFCPHSSVLARTKDGRIAGFFIAVPDYAPLIKQGATDRISASDFKFSRDFDRLPKPRTILAKTVGIHPDFRRSGLSKFLGLELSIRALAAGYETVIGALIRADNHSALFPARYISNTRTYGLFKKTLEG